MATETDNIRYLKGVGEKRAELFSKLGIDTVGALLRFYPRQYEDWSVITPIKDARGLGDVCIKAEVISEVKENYIRKNMVLYKFKVKDDSAIMSVTIFNNKYAAQTIKVGSEILLYGKLSTDSFYFEMSSPQIRPVGFDIIRPIYPTTYKLTSSAIEKAVKMALTTTKIDDFLPKNIIEKNNLCSREFAVRNIHFPENANALKEAKRRLVFEELFMLQAGLLLIKNVNRGKTPSVMKNDFSAEFQKLLPFEMTSAQKRCIKEAVVDMSSNRPMNRLVQGDVGSGKTAVAMSCCFTAVKNGYQAALMAPTEILAEQHFKTFVKTLEGANINVALLTGSLTKKKKDELKARLESGEIDIVIGTHAILTDNVYFKNLGLVITDEQHRFGVKQRAALKDKGNAPHILVMSATPIPRTLALIMHGDLDISIIDEYPKGRQPIDTYCVDTTFRTRIYNFIKKHIEEGRQGYIVCPLVEDGEEESNLVSAENYFALLKDGDFEGYNLGLLHGKMKPKEKDAVMRSFSSGDINLLIATTVVEVGVDVPNAAIMVIENAERFGLSQLHQLRGRIGRGGYKSSCILISDSKSARDGRLKTMCDTMDGFEIADKDLALRGPGDFLGNRQHGLPELHIANLESDLAILRSAGMQARELIDTDPLLKSSDNAAFKSKVEKMLYEANSN
ncbi:MAG: ATP-dependent DNA helicase RecG [Clostridia bacterium]|nr:ATP-dependent DNA helicase RecG [Clostridia bacterium]